MSSDLTHALATVAVFGGVFLTPLAVAGFAVWRRLRFQNDLWDVFPED